MSIVLQSWMLPVALVGVGMTLLASDNGDSVYPNLLGLRGFGGIMLICCAFGMLCGMALP